MRMMKKTATTLLLALVAGTSFTSAQESPEPADHRGRVVRTWDPYLAQWRIEQPRRTWDPNLAQYRYESRDQVWDPYLARYRPRDARRDPAPAFDRQADGRHRHPGQQGWCSARH